MDTIYLPEFDSVLKGQELTEYENTLISSLIHDDPFRKYRLEKIENELIKFLKTAKWLWLRKWPSGNERNQEVKEITTMYELMNSIYQNDDPIKIYIGRKKFEFKSFHWRSIIELALIKELGPDSKLLKPLGDNITTLPKPPGKNIKSAEREDLKFITITFINFLQNFGIAKDDCKHISGYILGMIYEIYNPYKDKERQILKRNVVDDRTHYLNSIKNLLRR